MLFCLQAIRHQRNYDERVTLFLFRKSTEKSLRLLLENVYRQKVQGREKDHAIVAEIKFNADQFKIIIIVCAFFSVF